MPSTAIEFDNTFQSRPLRALTDVLMWDNDETVTFYLHAQDADADGVLDWEQHGAADAMRAVFASYAAVADITFAETDNLVDANLVEYLGFASGALGFHYFPGQQNVGWLAPGRQSNGNYAWAEAYWTEEGFAEGGFARLLLIHEIGHALGLRHTHDGVVLDGVFTSESLGTFGLNQGVYTAMTYNDGWAQRDGLVTATTGGQATPMALDIAAVQALYGANMTTATGDDAYEMGLDTAYRAIWDAGGQDEIAYEGDADAVIHLTAATIDTSPTGGGLVSYVDGAPGGFTIAQGVVVEDARTGGGDDLLAGNAANNRLDGGAGDDLIVGLDGADMLIGGAGDDVLIGDYRPRSGREEPDDPEPGTTAQLPGGLSEGAGVLRVPQGTDNAAPDTAIGIGDLFALTASGDLTGDGPVFNLRIDGTGDGAADMFGFRLDERADMAFDIDGAAFDTWLALFDGAGNEVAFNDDSSTGAGGGGSTSTLDSYLRVTLAPGAYTIAVYAYPEAPIPVGADYTLNVSADADTLGTDDGGGSGPMPVQTVPFGYAEQLAYYFETPGVDAAVTYAEAEAMAAKYGSHTGHYEEHGHGGGYDAGRAVEPQPDADDWQSLLAAWEDPTGETARAGTLESLWGEDDYAIA